MARDLLHQRCVGDVVEAGTAVLDRHDAAGEAELAGLLHELLREALELVVLRHAWGDLALAPLTGEVEKRLLLVAEAEFHRQRILRETANRLVEISMLAAVSNRVLA